MNSILLIENTNRWLNRILKVTYLNLLWFMGVLVGGVIFGVGPATIAIYSVYRKWFLHGEHGSTTKDFISFYKTNFKEGAILGILYLVVGYLLIVDLFIARSWYLRYAIYLAIFIYFVSLLYLPGLVAHYEKVSIIKRIKMSIVIGFVYFQYTLVGLVIVGVYNFVLFYFSPGVFIIIGVSTSALIITFLNQLVFKKVDATIEMAEVEQRYTEQERGGNYD